MTTNNTTTNHTASTALQRIESTAFELAFAEYQRQRAALEGVPREKQDWSKGNPLNPLDDAHAALMELPAPNFDALLRKMEAVTGPMAENMGWEAQYFIDDLIADLRRLLGKEDASSRFAAYGLAPDMTREEALHAVDRIIDKRDFPNGHGELPEDVVDRMADEAARIVDAYFAHVRRVT